MENENEQTTQKKNKKRHIPMPEYLKNLPRITTEELIAKLKKSYHLTDEEEQEIRDELE